MQKIVTLIHFPRMQRLDNKGKQSTKGCSKWYCNLFVVGQFVCLNDPWSYAGGGLELLVGPPILNRSKGRDQTKSIPLVLQVRGWVQG